MRTITLTRREARLMVGNLTGNEAGYDYVDLCKLDWLAKKLTALQGEYADRLAELAREEKGIRRQLLREQITQAEAERALLKIRDEVEEMDEVADTVTVELVLEDKDHKLIADKLSGVKWSGNDAIRHVVIGMVAAVENAEQFAADTPDSGNGKIKELKKRDFVPV